jgi:DNA-binding NarL/FixJ family response regulator
MLMAIDLDRHVPGLPPRKCDVARALAGGLTVDEIASRLVIGRETVPSHLRELRRRTGLHSSQALALWAAQHRGCCYV